MHRLPPDGKRHGAHRPPRPPRKTAFPSLCGVQTAGTPDQTPRPLRCPKTFAETAAGTLSRVFAEFRVPAFSSDKRPSMVFNVSCKPRLVIPRSNSAAYVRAINAALRERIRHALTCLVLDKHSCASNRMCRAFFSGLPARLQLPFFPATRL